MRPTQGADLSKNKASGVEISLQPTPPIALEASVEAILHPPELRAEIEVEERWVRQNAAHFTICSTAISSIEAGLISLSTGEKKDFLDSIKVYLRSAIAQFVAAGPSRSPKVKCIDHCDYPLGRGYSNGQNTREASGSDTAR